MGCGSERVDQGAGRRAGGEDVDDAVLNGLVDGEEVLVLLLRVPEDTSESMQPNPMLKHRMMAQALGLMPPQIRTEKRESNLGTHRFHV